MSILLKKFGPRQLAKANWILSVAQASHWYPDLQPGPYPRTKEEREAAARKYNLLPEEYEPYPEDTDDVCGDYPKLPYESVDSRDPWYPWDNPELRKDFGEPVHKRMVNLLPETESTGPQHISHEKGTLIFLGIMGTLTGILLFFGKFKIITPVMEEQCVTPGVTHYTFELNTQ